ncbi:MAG: HEAT repeat domain-containing protein [Candidatus Jordarchaeaceae archaeon]
MDEDLRNELSKEEREVVEKIEMAVEGITEIEDWEFEDEALKLYSDLDLTFYLDFERKTLYLYSQSNYGAYSPQGDTVEEVANWFRKYAEQIEKEHRKMIEMGFEPDKVEHDDVYNIFCLYSKAYRFKQLDELVEDIKKLTTLWDELENDWKKLYPQYQYDEYEEEYEEEYEYEDEEEEKLEKLVEQLENEDREVRLNALIAIGDYACDGMTTESALPKLTKLLDDEDEEMRMNAAYALGDYACDGLTVETILPKLEKLLEDRDERVRGGAAYAIASYATKGLTIKSALPKLLKLLKDKSEETRDYAAYALDEYDERGLRP